MFNKKTVTLFLLLLIAIPSSFAQLKTYSFQEAEKLAIENPKPIVVLIHTSWCKYCKLMENSTFKNPEVIRLLNKNFYFVSLDAETKKPITFNQHTFQFQPTGTNTGIHELATALATINNQVVYPTVTILGTNNTIEYQQHSYISAKTFVNILEKIEKN